MSKDTLGSLNGITTANTNMVDVFRRNEIELYQSSILAFAEQTTIKKIGIQCDPGTEVSTNGCDIPTVSGVLELGYGQIDITSLAFRQTVAVNIYYMY